MTRLGAFGNILSLIVIVSTSMHFTDAKADDKAQACKRLGDEIRTRVDRLVAGDPMPRLAVALEAHKRLQCPVDDLVQALGFPPSNVDKDKR